MKNISLQVRYGEIYGLLGANGAGKTTTIKMLCGLLDPTTGTMQLAGATGSNNLRSQEVRQRIGYMSQKFSLYDDLTIRENLEFFAGVYGVPENEREEKRHWVLSFSGLEGKQDLITGSLPGGWKQRVAFGAAIMHEPSVLFLDEPTSGVDPLARRAFWTMINRLADAGTAILVTTHYLEEAEQCNRLGLMVAGEFVAEGTPSGIKSRQTGHLLEVRVDQPQRAADVLKVDTERWRVALFGDRLHVITDDNLRSRKASHHGEAASEWDPGARAYKRDASPSKTSSSASSRRRASRASSPARTTEKSRSDETNLCANSQGTDADRARLPHAGPGAGAPAGSC